ncbi:MAG: glycosyltransferase family 1 protein [Verrucomicrobiota bacterium]|nr:glycosyltransferase family 1 protein [Verrucomicrobiota bacterium]
MRIALVTETYPPEVNGVAMTLQRLTQGLARRGHQLHVIRPRQTRVDVTRTHDGVEEIPMPGLPLPGYQGLHFGLPAKGRLLQEWRTLRPDIVHIATEGPLGWSAIRAARKLRIPLVSSFHTNFHSYGQHYGFGLLQRVALGYLRYIHNQTLATLAPSQDVIQALTADGFREVGLLGRGVDTELFNPNLRDPILRREWGANEQTPVALYVGRIAGEKNLPLTITAFETMRQLRPDMRMVFVGDGPELRKLKSLYPDYHYAGMRRGEELARHYASGDVFLFASMTETFGNVVTEAMASGLLVLAYDYAAPKQYIANGKNGVLVPFGDGGAYTHAARLLARDTSDWGRLRTAARQTAYDIGWANAVLGLEKRYEQLVATGSALHGARPSVLVGDPT